MGVVCVCVCLCGVSCGCGWGVAVGMDVWVCWISFGQEWVWGVGGLVERVSWAGELCGGLRFRRASSLPDSDWRFCMCEVHEVIPQRGFLEHILLERRAHAWRCACEALHQLEGS